MSRFSTVLLGLAVTAVITLSGCESSEERAERHFQSAMELLEQGDVSRAIVEFKNVFKLNPLHKEARLAYANTRLEQGKRAEAYGQFLRVIEQYPDAIDARIILAEMAIIGRNWEEADRHGEQAVKLAPDDPRVTVIATALAFREAAQNENAQELVRLAELATTQLDDMPGNLIARTIVIDSLLSSGAFAEALPVIDGGLEQDPDNYLLHRTKLSTNLQIRDAEAIGQTLEQMVAQFPDDEDARGLLIAWYIDQGDMTGAEAFLRDLAARPDSEDGAQLAVVEFLRRTKGDEAAREELERLIATGGEDTATYTTLLASINFAAGEQDAAIASLEALVDGAEETTVKINNAKFILSRMLDSVGNPVGARARIEEILADDASHVGALKARAIWRIEDDMPNEAIFDLRTALSQAPRDAQIMTIMARAHERAGDRALALERYALAVELSDRAPEESFRYARRLIADDRIESAEAVVVEALNRSPEDIRLLQLASTIHLQNQDWNEVQRVVWKLRAIDSEEALAAANGIEADLMLRQDRLDDTIEFFGELARTTDDTRALAGLVQTQLRAGDIEDAVKTVEERLTASPKDPTLRYLRAGLHILLDERDQGKAIYRGLLTDFPGNDRVVRLLYSLLLTEGRADDARALIDEQIALNQKSLSARLLKAELLERDRDFEGAIAIYKEVYTEDSNNVLVANNLASLITAHRDDQESLDRAYAIARRLRDIEVPALQDTYGWIEFRRGNYQEALDHLEPAAAGLASDPVVQYHLGRTYLALERFAEARETLERAIQIAGDRPLPQIERARALLETIPSGTP